jgi:hypothetical protein
LRPPTINGKLTMSETGVDEVAILWISSDWKSLLNEIDVEMLLCDELLRSAVRWGTTSKT